MDRRQLLRLGGVSALALALGPGLARRARATRPVRRIIVIGAGIIGAAIGYELSRRGAEVTILEQRLPASGTTADSFAYLNASTKTNSRPYFELNRLGLAAWREWGTVLGESLPVQWGGAVYWREEATAAAQLRETLRTAQSWGYGGSPLDAADLRRLLPDVVPGDVAGGAFFEEEGAVDPVGAVTVLLEAARRHGAQVKYPVEVKGFLAGRSGRVSGVRTREGDIAADAVVVAAGLGSEALAKSLDVRLPLKASQGLLAHIAAQPRRLERVAFAPTATIRQQRDGRVLASSGHEGADATTSPAEAGQRILENAARYLPDLKSAKVERVSVGQRVLPADSFPIVGFAPSIEQLYFVVTHSGVTLAPALARIAALELLDGVEVGTLLSTYRPSRFA